MGGMGVLAGMGEMGVKANRMLLSVTLCFCPIQAEPDKNQLLDAPL